MIRPSLFAFASWLALSFVAIGCAPKRDLSVEQITHVQKLSELMDALATVADPQMKKRDQKMFTDVELATFADVSARMQAAALHIKDFSKGPEFDTLAVHLHDYAADLLTAAQAKDPAKIRDTLGFLKSTCKECHKKFR
jgi:cytochrome c556